LIDSSTDSSHGPINYAVCIDEISSTSVSNDSDAYDNSGHQTNVNENINKQFSSAFNQVSNRE
jgi:hypothetical protein